MSEITNSVLRLAKDPLSVFLLMGAGIFAAYSVTGGQQDDPVTYSPQVEASLVEEFEMLAGRPAGPEDVARLKRDFLTDELLFREAVERGIYLTDSKIRAQMIDQVRYLITGTPPEPDEEMILNHYAENLERYESEPEISFEQVYFSTQPADPGQLLASLRRGDKISGEDLWTGQAYPDYGQSMIRGIFGQDFLARIEDAPSGTWIGPVESIRGWHFVRKSGNAEARLLPYVEVRDQVRQDLMMAEMQQAIDSAFDELKNKYEVRVDA